MILNFLLVVIFLNGNFNGIDNKIIIIRKIIFNILNVKRGLYIFISFFVIGVVIRGDMLNFKIVNLIVNFFLFLNYFVEIVIGILYVIFMLVLVIILYFRIRYIKLLEKFVKI